MPTAHVTLGGVQKSQEKKQTDVGQKESNNSTI